MDFIEKGAELSNASLIACANLAYAKHIYPANPEHPFRAAYIAALETYREACRKAFLTHIRSI